ncbi:MAG TPA: FAD-binding oxidoreductase [Casimicrobiaceae bacterium]|nr:FAD-binding oxidoreductase [Casimicrobiaceae bacterium]
MNTTVPESVSYVVVGAGIHGLSTAWHLAMELSRRATGSGTDVIVVDKTGPGAGASGIACGCVRNLYMTEPIHAILRHSVDVWTYDPVAFGFQQVGYVSAGEANQAADYERLHASQHRVGYPSNLYFGADARTFLTSIWPDFKIAGIDVVLHEKVSGYAGTRQAIAGLAQKCRDHGVRIVSGVEVNGYETTGGRVTRVLTSAGDIRCDAVVLGLGAWTPKHWAMLGKPSTIDARYPDGSSVRKDMWTYWRLLEGEVYVDRPYRTAGDLDPPVLHVELMNTPVIEPSSKRMLADHLYVYWKNGAERMDRPGVQGGTIPIRIGPNAVTDPYGHDNDAYQAEPEFADYLTAAMGQLMGRFEGARRNFRERRNGGIGAFTPDNVPIFDFIAPNVYMIADSNHGFKMTGVGKLVARLLASGERVSELTPFTFDRFANGRTFGASNSHCPWV